MNEPQTATEDISDAIPPSATGVLTIDLAAICENYRRLHQASGMRGTAAMVKADAYGLGAEAVAPALARCGARSFFVSTLDEGLALRPCLDAAVPACSIYVLNGPMEGCEALYQEQKLLSLDFQLEALLFRFIWEPCYIIFFSYKKSIMVNNSLREHFFDFIKNLF
jgi:hypothetical protein